MSKKGQLQNSKNDKKTELRISSIYAKILGLIREDESKGSMISECHYTVVFLLKKLQSLFINLHLGQFRTNRIDLIKSLLELHIFLFDI